MFSRESQSYQETAHSRAKELTLEARLQEARAQLLSLYAAATKLRLPYELEADVHAMEPRAHVFVDLGKYDSYYEVFDPYVDDGLVGGSLADDFGDIARDLECGMAYWGAGFQELALWEWQFHFDSHWGDHAVDALRAPPRLQSDALNGDLRSRTDLHCRGAVLVERSDLYRAA